MDLARQDELEKQLKGSSKQGSMGALIEYVKWMQHESQEKYNGHTGDDHRYLQSRVNILDDILDLLGSTSK